MFMPPPPPPPEDQPAPQFDVHGYVLQCIEKGSTPAQIRKQLIARGHNADEANTIVDSVVRWRKDEYARGGVDLDDPASIRAAGRRNMVMGGAICLVGVAVTLATWTVASESGGRFILAGGAIVWGFIQFCRGAVQASSGRLQ